MIVVNDVKVEGVGFGIDMNVVIFYFWDGRKWEFVFMFKFDVFFEMLKEMIVLKVED